MLGPHNPAIPFPTQFIRLRLVSLLGIVVRACNPSNQEVEAGGSQVQGQSGLHGENLCEQTKKLTCGAVEGSHNPFT
jgi:hypothetical protein